MTPLRQKFIDELELRGLSPLTRDGFRPEIVRAIDSVASLLVRVANSEAVAYSLPMAARLPHQGVVFAKLDPRDAIMLEMHLGWRRDDPRTALIEALDLEMAARNMP